MNAPGSAAERRARKRGLFVSPLARVVRSVVHGEPVFFTVVNPRDEIQKHHLEGKFYEPEELAIIARHFPVGGRFCDIGTNVGNHSLYVAKFLHAARIVMFEPNPAAIEILESNVNLNGIGAVCDRQFLGMGLSDKAVEGASMRVPARNLGGSRVIEGEGDIRLAPLDDLLPGEVFDLIKIDVEGMELKVLAGMRRMLAASHPRMFIEVDAVNYKGFEQFLAEVGYTVIESFQRYERNTNFLVGPKA